MSSKTFCDECEKEIKDKGVRISYYLKGFTIFYYCPDCFQKHWQGPLPASPNSGQGGPKEKE